MKELGMSGSTVVDQAGASASEAIKAALEGRANIIDMTQVTEEAVLKPSDPGAWSHDVRAAMTSRIARQNKEDGLADFYATFIENADVASLADPETPISDDLMKTVCGFMDKVAMNTSQISASDIAALQAAGVTDADIVRLCEINAFMAYQVRLLTGLKLMQETAK